MEYLRGSREVLNREGHMYRAIGFCDCLLCMLFVCMFIVCLQIVSYYISSREVLTAFNMLGVDAPALQGCLGQDQKCEYESVRAR